MLIGQALPVVGEAALAEQRRVKVPCRSFLTRALCCIPTIGVIAQCISEVRLQKNIKKSALTNPASERRRVVEHLKIKNTVIKCGVYRELCEIALTIIGIALGVFIVNVVLPSLIFSPILILLYKASIAKNKRKIESVNDPLNHAEEA